MRTKSKGSKCSKLWALSRGDRLKRVLVIWEEPAICGNLYRRPPGELPAEEQVCFPISNRIASSPSPVGTSIHPLLLRLHLNQSGSHMVVTTRNTHPKPMKSVLANVIKLGIAQRWKMMFCDCPYLKLSSVHVYTKSS